MEENFKEEILENLGTPHEIVLCLEILKTLFHLLPEVAENSNQKLLVEWKAPYKNININTKTHLGSQPTYTHIFFSYCTNMGWDSSQNCTLDYNQANYLRIRCSVQRKSCLIAWD